MPLYFPPASSSTAAVVHQYKLAYDSFDNPKANTTADTSSNNNNCNDNDSNNNNNSNSNSDNGNNDHQSVGEQGDNANAANLWAVNVAKQVQAPF